MIGHTFLFLQQPHSGVCVCVCVCCWYLAEFVHSGRHTETFQRLHQLLLKLRAVFVCKIEKWSHLFPVFPSLLMLPVPCSSLWVGIYIYIPRDGTFLLVHVLLVKLHQGEGVLDEIQLLSELDHLVP